MNIDQQIKQILSRSLPVNDNQKPINKHTESPSSFNNGISVVGNHNVVISSNILTTATFIILFGILFLLSQH